MTCLKLDLTLAGFKGIFYSSTISKSNTFHGLFNNKLQFLWLAIPSIPSAIILAAVHLWIKYFLPESASDSSCSLVTNWTWNCSLLNWATKQHHAWLFSAALCCQHTFCWLVLKWSLSSKYRTEEYKVCFPYSFDTDEHFKMLYANNIHKPLVRWGGTKMQPKFRIHHSVMGFPTSV